MTVVVPPPVGTTTLTEALIVEGSAPATGVVDETSESNPPSDRRLGDRIQNALVSDDTMKDVGMHSVRLSARNHRVRLRGVGSSIADKVAIEQRVREVRDVEAVDNELAVLH